MSAFAITVRPASVWFSVLSLCFSLVLCGRLLCYKLLLLLLLVRGLFFLLFTHLLFILSSLSLLFSPLPPYLATVTKFVPDWSSCFMIWGTKSLLLEFGGLLTNIP